MCTPYRCLKTFNQKCQWSQTEFLSLGSMASGLSGVGGEVKLRDLQYEAKWSVL